MQGQHPTGYAPTPTQRATSDTTRNVNRNWTCQRWFNNIADKVSTKTHPYFGKLVAVAMLPFTFIPSLACDVFYGAKSLYQRTVSTAPVLSHFSTGSSSSPTSELNTSPTIDQLRQKFPVLDFYITDLEAAKNEAIRQHTGTFNVCEQLLEEREEVAQANQDNIEKLNKKIEDYKEQLSLYRSMVDSHADKYKSLQLLIGELKIKNSDLKDCLPQFQDTKPSPGPDCTEEGLLKTSGESFTSTSVDVDSQPKPIIIIEEDDSTTETDHIHPVSTMESTDDNCEAVIVHTTGTEPSATDANNKDTSSDESFENIPLPLSDAPK